MEFILGFITCWFVMNFILTVFLTIREGSKVKKWELKHFKNFIWKFPVMLCLGVIIVLKFYFDEY